MKGLFVMILLLSAGAFATEGKEVYDKKCATCHEIFIPLSKLEKNFMQMDNKLLNLTAPTTNQLVYRLKTRIGDPNGDKEIHRMEIESFLEDYFENPDKQKSICLPEVIKHFDTMPAVSDDLNDDEFAAIVTFLYNYDPKVYQQRALTYSTLSEAQQKASREDKMTMIFFTAEHCGYCKKMEREVMSDQEVIGALDRSVVAVKIDLDHEKSPIDFTPSMTPTFVFMNDRNEILYKVPGSWNKEDFIEIIKEADEKFAVSKKGEK